MSTIGRTLVRSTRLATTLAALALLSMAAAPASAQEPVEFGDVITEPGVYFLNGNQSGSGVGILIESDDVVLLLLRFTLRGGGGDSGVWSNGYDNVTIYGGRITNFKYGILMQDGEYCTVKDTRVDHCLEGLALQFMYESSFLRVRCDYNLDNGLVARNCYESRFVSILAHDNGFDGILLVNQAAGDGDGNKVRLCWAAYNGRDGIRVFDSEDNDLKSNQCVGNQGAGIRLDTSSDDGLLGGPETRYNHLEANWCVFNHDGIVVEWSAWDNTIFGNTALANSGHDLVENNFELPCKNTWFLNFFLTKDGDGEDCIF